MPIHTATNTESNPPHDLLLVPLRRRTSAFVEVGLGGEDAIIDGILKGVDSRPRMQVRFSNEVDIFEPKRRAEVPRPDNCMSSSQLARSTTPYLLPPSRAFPNMSRLFLLALLLAVAMPSFHNSPFFKAGISSIGATAGPIKTAPRNIIKTLSGGHVKRADSPTDICTRWAQQSAIINNTLYIYGGQATTDAGQASNTWSE